MSDYRRYFVPGGTFFFTVVTYARRPILITEGGRRFLRTAIESVRKRHPFSLVANVLLPDHWHLVIQLPAGDDRYSLRIKQIKAKFTEQWMSEDLPEAKVTASQQKRGERGIWQPRFWEHTVLDEEDLERCVDYIHWNPMKHKLVSRVRDWEWSSFHRFVESGQYDAGWGGTAPDGSDEETWGNQHSKPARRRPDQAERSSGTCLAHWQPSDRFHKSNSRSCVASLLDPAYFLLPGSFRLPGSGLLETDASRLLNAW